MSVATIYWVSRWSWFLPGSLWHSCCL
jgi:hypothetical protein